MRKLMVCLLLWMMFVRPFFAFALELDPAYSCVVQKILFYKNDRFKVFYGGPVKRLQGGVQWVMPISFEDDLYKTRAVYEVSFINCDLTNCENVDLLFVRVSDINIKLKNTLSQDYKVFSSLLNGDHPLKKYIVIRASDVCNVCYPDIHIFSLYGEHKESDKKTISNFLHAQFKTKKNMINYYLGGSEEIVEVNNAQEICYKPIPIKIDFSDKTASFTLVKRILKNDEWKVYYTISKENAVSEARIDECSSPLIRIDSGCISGQIYDDDSCDCLDQLHDGLYQIASDASLDSLIIHIPSHDGRGYGMAPKAETEIYKQGGRGRVNETLPLNTVDGAKLLYSSGIYDIRTYDGVALILNKMQMKAVCLLTDNIVKVESLKRYGIDVIRKKTETKKQTCIKHIESKANSEFYYKS